MQQKFLLILLENDPQISVWCCARIENCIVYQEQQILRIAEGLINHT